MVAHTPYRLLKSRPPRAEALPMVAVVAAAIVCGAAAARDPVVAVALGVAFLAAAIAVVWPALVPPAVVFLVVTNVPAVAVNTYGLPLAVGAAALVALAIPAFAYVVRDEPVYFDATLMWIGTFAVASVLSLGLNPGETERSVRVIVTLLAEGLILYFLFINAVRTRSVFMWCVSAAVYAGALLGSVAIAQQLTQTYDRFYFGLAGIGSDFLSGKSTEPRALGPIGDSNYFGQMLLLILPLSVSLLVVATSLRRRVTWSLTTASILGGIAFTLSRGAIVALVIVALGMVALGLIGRRGLTLLAVAVAVLLVAVPGYRDRVLSLSGLVGVEASSSSDVDPSFQGRLSEALAARDAFLDRPLLGVGPGNFPAYYQHYAERYGINVHQRTTTGESRGEVPEREAHNLVLGLLANVGIIGTTAFFAAITCAVMGLLRARRRVGPDVTLEAVYAGLLLGIGGFVLAGFFLSLAYERYLWVALALAGAGVRLAGSRLPSSRSLGRAQGDLPSSSI